MKKSTKFLFLLSLTWLFSAINSQAQVIVRVRPHRPAAVVVRPVAPSPRHIWVSEEWVPNGSRYVYHPGYWVAPPHPRAVWVGGHWRHARRGYVWLPGRWR